MHGSSTKIEKVVVFAVAGNPVISQDTVTVKVPI